MELRWKNLTLNEDWLQVRLCLSFCWFLFTAKRKWAGSEIICLWHWVPWVPSVSPQPGDLCFPQLRWCCTKGLGDFVPSLPVCDPLLPPRSSLCCRAQREHHFPHFTLLCPVLSAGSSSLEIPAQSSPAQQSWTEHSFGHGTFAKLCTSGHAPKFLTPGFTEVLWRAESREKSACRAFYDSKWPELLKGPLCPLPDGSGCNEHPFLTALNPSSHGQHLQWTPQWYQLGLMQLLLICSRPTLLLQPVLATSKQRIWNTISNEGCPCRNNLGKKLVDKQEVLLS